MHANRSGAEQIVPICFLSAVATRHAAATASNRFLISRPVCSRRSPRALTSLHLLDREINFREPGLHRVGASTETIQIKTIYVSKCFEAKILD